MKKVLLLFIICFSFCTSFAQPSGMLNETFNLKSIETSHLYYTPNGESPNIKISEVAGNYTIDADGINNTLNAAASFNGNSLILNDYAVTMHDCLEPNCYYEDLYFYDILTTVSFDSKTLTYHYREDNGYKYLNLRDAENNIAVFSTEPAPEPNPMLFQTWYLYMTEVDMGDPVFYPGPNPPQITINPDFTYTGIENCALISGDFILGNATEFYDFTLQARNYVQDESSCPPGSIDYIMWELGTDLPLGSNLSEGDEGIHYFQFESYAGFVSYFVNQLILSTPKNHLSEIKIYPNPAHNTLTIQSTEQDLELHITDLNGRSIMAQRNYKTNEIDISALNPGMYFLNIQSLEGKITKKFIKN